LQYIERTYTRIHAHRAALAVSGQFQGSFTAVSTAVSPSSFKTETVSRKVFL